jgi:peptidoglycan/xylan/chitin deacetylase (PgdA/CDA1 family)
VAIYKGIVLMLRPLVKKVFYIVTDFMGHSAFNFIYKNYFKNSLTIFLYHEVNDKPSEFADSYQLNTPPKIFQEQIDAILKNYNILNPSDVLKGKWATDKPSALITFDDGTLDIFENALPILKKRSINPIVFMNFAMVKGNEIFWSALKTFLSTKSLEFKKFLADKGIGEESYHTLNKDIVDSFLSSLQEDTRNNLINQIKDYYGTFPSYEYISKLSSDEVTLGNHLYNHFNANYITSDHLEEQYLKNDIILKELRQGHQYFAYPFGQSDCFSEKTNQQIEKLGAKVIFSAINKVNKANKNPLDRISLTNTILSERQIKGHIIRSEIVKLFRS